MSRIPVHTLDSAPEASRDALGRLEKRYGKVLNGHGEMANAPVVLGVYMAMNEAISRHGTFDARTREAIALAVGAVDACGYCQAAHTIAGKNAGLTEEETVAIRRGTVEFDPKLAALVAVAREIAGEIGEVSDATWQRAVAAGWDNEQLTEVFAHVAVNLFTNYFTHYARTDLDLPAAPSLDG